MNQKGWAGDCLRHETAILYYREGHFEQNDAEIIREIRGSVNFFLRLSLAYGTPTCSLIYSGRVFRTYHRGIILLNY